MKLRFTRLALADVMSIRDYIAQDDLTAAEHVVDHIARTIDLLRDFPRLGHAGVVAGALELVVPGLPYVVVYQSMNGPTDEIVILRVYHTAQDRR